MTAHLASSRIIVPPVRLRPLVIIPKRSNAISRNRVRSMNIATADTPAIP